MSLKWKPLAGVVLLTGVCAFPLLSAPQVPAETAKLTAEDVFRIIRTDNLIELHLLLSAGAAKLTNSQKTTPLHYAALYGSVESMNAFLAAGADPNARDLQESTPLIYAAYNAAKTRLLVEHGAQVNVRNHVGATPLIVAASAVNNSVTVKYLLEKGATANADVDQGRALLGAANFGDQESVKALLAHGASAKTVDKAGNSGLMAAMNLSSGELTNLLLTAGSDVNASNMFAGAVKNGPIALTHLTPLMLAAPHAKPEIMQALLRSGARVNDVDGRKMSPLMLAVATDQANPETVKSLIAAGADVNQMDRNGESVLDWALKFGNEGIISDLRRAGAKEAQKSPAPPRPAEYRPQNVNTALAKSHALLATSGQKFFSEGGGCWGCHHQPMDARAYAASRDAGLPVDEHLKRLLLDSVVANRPRSFRFFPILADTGGDIDPLLSALTALADLREPAGPDTDVMIHYIAARQLPSGAWNDEAIARPPVEESDITRTASAIRALTVYGWPARHAEFEQRIQRGRAWLLSAIPKTNYERADLLLGLFYTDAPRAALQRVGAALLKEQREDGGWAQTSTLTSDAYATGMALHALYKAGLLQASDRSYQRGVRYLLAAQFPDGSWYVRSRAPKFQPYFQSGFPFEHDQWISSTATGWAAMALAPAAALEQHKQDSAALNRKAGTVEHQESK